MPLPDFFRFPARVQGPEHGGYMKEMTPTGRLWPFLGIVMLLVLVAGLALPGLDRVRTASGDAIFYQYYINFFLKAPVSEYPRLFDIYFNQPQHTGFTTPIRPGYILPLALLARIIGPSFFLMARVSLAAHLGTVLLAWFFLSRWQGPVVGLATAALVAFSPLLLPFVRPAFAASCLLALGWIQLWLPKKLVRTTPLSPNVVSTVPSAPNLIITA